MNEILSLRHFLIVTATRLRIPCLAISMLLAGMTVLRGQDPLSGTFETATSDTVKKPPTPVDDLLQDLFDNDTVIVDYYRYGNQFQFFPLDDTLLSGTLRQLDPGRQKQPYLLHLGNYGSPALTELFRPSERDAFSLGVHGFDPYNITFDNFTFLRPQTAYTNVRYGLTTGVRDDNVFSGTLSRPFDNNLHGNLHYSRLNQIGSLLRDKARNTNLGAGLEQSHLNGRYTTHLIYTFNQYFREENGGIVSDAPLSQPGFAGNIQNLPIHLNAAGSKTSNWGILFGNDLALTGRRDTTSKVVSSRGLHLGYEVSYRQEKMLFYDTDVNAPSDTVYYRAYNIDRRGIRQDIKHRFWRNMAYLSFNGAPAGPDNPVADYFRAGVSLEHHKIVYLPTDSTFTILKIHGEGQWRLKNVAGIRAKGYLQLNAPSPVFDLSGEISGGLGSTFQAKGWLQLRNTPPGYLLSNLHLNAVTLARHAPNNMLHTYYGGRLSIPALRLGVSVHQNIINNFTYFDQDWQMQQSPDIIVVTGIEADYHLQLGFLNVVNYVLWQKAGTDIIRLPQLNTSHSLYAATQMLKNKLRLHIGFDLRYGAPYARTGYSPMLFNFYNPEGPNSAAYFNYDFFLAYKIRLLRGFVRVDNINTLYLKKAYYQIDQYPQDFFAIRLGFDWTFNN